MPTEKKKVRTVPGSPAARRKAPVTTMMLGHAENRSPVWPVLSQEAQVRGWRVLHPWRSSGAVGPKGIKIDGALAKYGPEEVEAHVRDLLQAGCPAYDLGPLKSRASQVRQRCCMTALQTGGWPRTTSLTAGFIMWGLLRIPHTNVADPCWRALKNRQMRWG